MTTVMWMKVLQVAIFAVTACALIYGRLDNGYAITLLSVLSAYTFTVLIPEAFVDLRNLASKKRRISRTD